MQTAVEWLFQKLPTIDKYDPYYSDIIKQAKEMEKQQMKDVLFEKVLRPFQFNFEQYYNETYRSGVLREGSGAVCDKGGAVASSQTEISDEEIEKAFTVGSGFKKTVYSDRIRGAKWYREQLKKKI